MQSDGSNQSPQNIPAYAQKQFDDALKLQQLASQVEHDLKTNPKYKTFFDRYNPASIKHFIQHYKDKKASWLFWGDMYKAIEHDKILKYSALAENKLWEIQQKKLFNLQCQWRAEAIQLPGILISYDFWYWEHFIRQCPFLAPITQDEYELYLDYILSDDFEMHNDHYYEWQRYEDYKAEYIHTNSGSTMPEWYQFYDSRRGTGVLLTLPDARGDKENFYLNLYFENYRKQNANNIPDNSTIDKRPSLRYYEPEVLEDFIDKFEPITIKDAYSAMRTTMEDSLDMDEKLSKAIATLKQAGNIEIAYAANWYDSILKTAFNYEKECFHKAFTIAYKNYLSRINMGISFDSGVRQNDSEHIISLVNTYKQNIIKGRILNNEPVDLNF